MLAPYRVIAVGVELDGDDGLAAYAAPGQIANRRGKIVQRADAVDDWLHLAGLDQSFGAERVEIGAARGSVRELDATVVPVAAAGSRRCHHVAVPMATTLQKLRNR